MNDNYYLETEDDRVKLPEKYAKAFAEILNKDQIKIERERLPTCDNCGMEVPLCVCCESKHNARMIEAKCQSCGAKVMIIENHPYNGILCSKCMKPKSYTLGPLFSIKV